MNIQPNQLADYHFQLKDHLNHKELIPFVQNYLKKKTKFSIFYYSFTSILLGYVIYLLVKDFSQISYSFSKNFSRLSWGFLGAFLLLPLHEYIHVLAYKYLGAKNTSYDVNLKKFYFLAIADQFVANKKEFIVVAIAPFIIISTALIVIYFAASSNWNLILISMLFAHTAMCSGDFGLMSYFQFHKDLEIVTYDDKSKSVSYFFEKHM